MPLVFLTMWQVHYAPRTFIYPFRTRYVGYTTLSVVMKGLALNLANAYINARSFPSSGTTDSGGWATLDSHLERQYLFLA